ncbi:LIM/homeobox protein Lhx9-like [Hemiscyllium ocellatum]|uniref:LIM/homeobox protein Lhx9-like n=1 Tax=Hemiscyllium ocellatum TaxID=170820 RepID=UPI00296665F2|nr:LIM/homeobox protein Lhx9-like [Hemiscyllium ocellatum]
MDGDCNFQYSSLLLQGFPEEEIQEAGPEDREASHQNGLSLDMTLMEGLRHDLSAKAAVCAACGESIYDRYVLFAVDRPWHARCLKCCVCDLALGSELTCFSKDGDIYCKDDYYRRFCVKQCSRCHLGIPASEMVMRAKEEVYHVSCFTCAICGEALVTGDLFGTRQGLVYCQAHFELLCRQEDEARLMDGLSELAFRVDEGVSVGQRDNDWHTRRGSARKRRGSRHHTEGDDFSQVCPETGQPLEELRYCGQQKAKRIRTCFKHHQLRTMESYFAIKHNPDGKDWEQLSKKTGLPKRVLQVWFQNARAKLRKSLLQEETTDSDTVSDPQELPQSPSAQQTPGVLGPPSPLFSSPSSMSTCSQPPRPTMAPIFLNFDPAESPDSLQTIDRSKLC